MYKIFFNKKIFILTDSIEQCKTNWFRYTGTDDLAESLKYYFEKSDIYRIVIFHENIKELFKAFRKNFNFIQAAGGLVRNTDGKYLVIYRLEKWDLPKGKIENGEKTEEAALREVTEECNVTNLQILKRLPSTYHIYAANNKKFLKETFWYEMLYEGSEELKPQIEEGITEVKWVEPKEIDELLKNTFTNLFDIFAYARIKKKK